MRVRELIDRLSGFDPDLRVVTPGFDETDLEDVETVRAVQVQFHDERQKFHGGRHKDVGDHGTPAVKIDWN